MNGNPTISEVASTSDGVQKRGSLRTSRGGAGMGSNGPSVSVKSIAIEQSENKAPIVCKVEDGFLVYYCPVCIKNHRLQIGGDKPRWTWNGDALKPTVSPDVYKALSPRCHHYIQGGKIQYLSDTEHEYAGSIVEMKPLRT